MPEKEKEKEQSKEDTNKIGEEEKRISMKKSKIQKKKKTQAFKKEENKKTNKENTYEPKITKKINVLTIIIDKTETLTDIPSEKCWNIIQLTRLKIESVNQEGCESTRILNLNQFTLPLINSEEITLSCQHKEIELKCQTYRIIK